MWVFLRFLKKQNGGALNYNKKGKENPDKN